MHFLSKKNKVEPMRGKNITRFFYFKMGTRFGSYNTVHLIKTSWDLILSKLWVEQFDVSIRLILRATRLLRCSLVDSVRWSFNFSIKHCLDNIGCDNQLGALSTLSVYHWSWSKSSGKISLLKITRFMNNILKLIHIFFV